MNFFKLKTTWTNAEFIPLKLCIASAYILVGAYFHHFILQYKYFFVVLFLITVTYAVYIWIDKTKKENRKTPAG